MLSWCFFSLSFLVLTFTDLEYDFHLHLMSQFDENWCRGLLKSPRGETVRNQLTKNNESVFIIMVLRRHFGLQFFKHPAGIILSTCIVCTTLSDGGWGEGGGWTSNQIFKKGVLTGPQFLDRACWKRVGDLFQGRRGKDYNFYIKSKLKSEIFTDKRSL